TPFNVVSGTDRALSGGGSQRPNLIADPVLDSGRPRGDLIARYFNPAAYAVPALGTFGNSGRNTLIGPSSYNLDGSLFKMFPIKEKLRLQFRAEFFNALNHANLANPVSNIASGTVGSILSASSPRIMQFGLRLAF